jgi:signal transduction histidine kinase
MVNNTGFKKEIKILIVDDREDNLFSIQTILEKDGYTITKANSGRSALKVLLHHHDFTLILMDVQMPDMNGFETASLIYQRQKLSHIPIIFITANDYGEESIFKGYETGGVDYIYKPINPDLLRYKVSVFVDLYRKNHQLLEQESLLKTVNSNLQKEIEERKIIQEKIVLLNKQLVDNNTTLKIANEELDRFAYIASHDLQEPLRKIMLFSDKILRLFDDENYDDVRLNLEKIIRSSKRMQQLIDDLLRYSRHANDSMDFQETDFNVIVKEVLADLEVEINEKNATVIAKKLPTVWAVPTQIRQLFQNIISNSLKFTQQSKSPTIVIESELLKGQESTDEPALIKQERFYRLYFRDNGIGFDEKYAEDIFRVFKRLHNYTEFEGTGIGLSICKKIVEKHSGFINVNSKINEVTTFMITLPYRHFQQPQPMTAG